MRTKNDYHQWIKVFARMESPVVAYFDADEFFDLFTELRRNLPANMTVVHRINRTQVLKFVSVLQG